MENPFFIPKLERSAVRGEFKRVGSSDPDILQATRSRLIAPSKSAAGFGKVFIVLGLISAITVIGIIATIFMVPMGVYVLGRAKSNIRVVDEIFEEITKSPVL